MMGPEGRIGPASCAQEWVEETCPGSGMGGCCGLFEYVTYPGVPEVVGM